MTNLYSEHVSQANIGKLNLTKLKFSKAIADSLPVRAILSVIIITVLVSVTAISSGILAWVAESDAKAINTAGSIRMATYRINYLMANHYQNAQQLDQTFDTMDTTSDNLTINQQLSNDMQKRLDILAEYEKTQGNKNQHITSQIELIQNTWQKTLNPLLLNDQQQQFFWYSTNYINSVDILVKQIQARNEQRQTNQQRLQIISLIITLIVMIIGLYELQKKVLIPVKELRKATYKFRQGIRTRVNITGYEEFNDLGESFNNMTQALSTYQDNLEAEVARKTFHLTQTNQILTLLYNFAKELSNQSIAYPKLQDLINQFSKLMPHLNLTMCLNNEQYKAKDIVALRTQDYNISHASNFCQQQHCDSCNLKQQNHSLTIPIHNQQTEWGELIVTTKSPNMTLSTKPHTSVEIYDFSQTHQLSQQHTERISLAELPSDDSTHSPQALHPSFDEVELLNTLANLIAMVFTSQKQREQEHQLILFEERNTIARELHDSLAQSLSYLKMQIAMLSGQLKQIELPPSEQQQRIEQTILQIKEGLNGAYSQLRELLVTFRLKIEEGEFDNALQQACDEFAQKGGFTIHLDNRLSSNNLTANEQIDLLQICREALSNINRHAQAKFAHVLLTQNQQGKVTLRVQDDGVGLNRSFDHRQHHGLKIMQERSHSINGEFSIENVLPHGTAILVKFLPKRFATQPYHKET